MKLVLVCFVLLCLMHFKFICNFFHIFHRHRHTVSECWFRCCWNDGCCARFPLEKPFSHSNALSYAWKNAPVCIWIKRRKKQKKKWKNATIVQLSQLLAKWIFFIKIHFMFFVFVSCVSLTRFVEMIRARLHLVSVIANYSDLQFVRECCGGFYVFVRYAWVGRRVVHFFFRFKLESAIAIRRKNTTKNCEIRFFKSIFPPFASNYVKLILKFISNEQTRLVEIFNFSISQTVPDSNLNS